MCVSRSQGFRVVPYTESVAPNAHSSGTVVRAYDYRTRLAEPVDDDVGTWLWRRVAGRRPDAHRLARDRYRILDGDGDAGQREIGTVRPYVHLVGFG